MSRSPLEVIVSPSAADRLAAARRWLASRPPSRDVTVAGDNLTGPRELFLHGAVAAGAAMGWRRTSLSLLAADLAASRLGAAAPAQDDRVAGEAVMARTLLGLGPEFVVDTHDAEGSGALDWSHTRGLGRLQPVADTPGFIRAMNRTVDEARMAGVAPRRVAEVDADLGVFMTGVEEEWNTAGLADRAALFKTAAAALRDPGFSHPAVGHPLLLLDARIWTELEKEFVGALLERSKEALATVPHGDERTLDALDACGAEPLRASQPRAVLNGGVRRIQIHLFDSPPPEHDPEEESFTIFSAPGEGREAVEVARRIVNLASAGAPFDQCAVVLRQPEVYQPHFEEAFARAGIPAYFAIGRRRPNPSGRALVALLRCRAEDYSARGFAEYVSIGHVPYPPEADTADGEVAGGDAARSETLSNGRDAGEEDGAGERPSYIPRRWEKLLVEAGVVGGFDRWGRRLDKLASDLDRQRRALERESPDDARLDRLDRKIADLGFLRTFATSILSVLAELPNTASWSEWLTALNRLATAALRYPEQVLAELSALHPMGPVGPVALDDVLRTLSPRLSNTTEVAPTNRFGRVFVGPPDAARGLAFDTVFVPGMAERSFPPKIAEDPLLLDEARSRLASGLPASGSSSSGLPVNRDRVAIERLAFRLAVGAARERIILSYPRIEATAARPLVPSFYALEAVQASEGRLPSFEELGQRAEGVSEVRIGWPAPGSKEQAIDAAEYDLAVLDDLGVRGPLAVKAAGHLLASNQHLARALRFRAYRWAVPRWTWADGLLDLGEGAAAALKKHELGERAFSATALQQFSMCPYKFYLYAINRLRVREEPVGIESLDPLQRGSLVHQAQFELLTRLQREGSGDGPPLLPVNPDNIERVREVLDEVLDKVAADFKDRLAPEIDRVWDDGITAIRQDLREWIRRSLWEWRDRRGGPVHVPWRFELAFGLPGDSDRDRRSVTDPVELEAGSDLHLKLRGSIDLVERTPNGGLRITDHKTGRFWAKPGAIIQGGEILQPVLYSMVARKVFPEERVESGRLYYCTAGGQFKDHTVMLDEQADEAVQLLAETLQKAFSAGAFPAMPREGACRWCDYRAVCGPDEERRAKSKPRPADLDKLRCHP